MKSKLLRLLIPVSLLLFLGSCAVNTVKVGQYKKIDKVALISIMSEKSVDTKAVDQGSLLAMAAKAAQGSQKTDLTNKMDELKTHLINESESIFGFDIIPEKQVINQKSYQSIDDSNKNMTQLIAPKGYKRIFANEKDMIAKAMGNLKGADAGMIVTMSSRLGKGPDFMGVGNVYVWVDMTFYLVDQNGELILHKTASEQSETSTKRVGGFFKTEDIQKMIVEAMIKDLKAVKTFVDEKLAAGGA